MEQENHRSSVGGMEGENLKPAEGDGGGSKQEAKFGENDAERRVSEADCSDCTAEKTISGERGESRSETQTSVRVSGNEFESYSPESSNTLMEVPVVYSLHPLQSAKNWKDEIRVLNKEPDKDIAGQPAGIEIQTQLQLQTVESGNSDCCTVQDKPNSLDPKPLSTVPMLKAPDGYNWRKYGQKQVKSPEGFRSYYRCTNSDCLAKKIECCDRSNHAIETVYRSHHNHDPPQKVNCARENKPSLAVAPVNGTHEITHSGRGLNDFVPSTPKESIVPIDRIQETKQQDSCGSDETTEINIKEEYVDGPEYKRRQKRSSSSELDSHNKSGKKPKYVVHAPGDDCISSDGYRWRKYGQKMVKGNPHPRNYYRCTSAGCPARKHIERAVDNAGAVVITYNGVHDHDMPVPRKRHGARNLTAAASVTADNLPINKTEPHQSQSQQSVDKESDSLSETLNPSGEKSSESARTLLSIGFEIKPC